MGKYDVYNMREKYPNYKFDVMPSQHVYKEKQEEPEETPFEPTEEKSKASIWPPIRKYEDIKPGKYFFDSISSTWVLEQDLKDIRRERDQFHYVQDDTMEPVIPPCCPRSHRQVVSSKSQLRKLIRDSGSVEIGDAYDKDIKNGTLRNPEVKFPDPVPILRELLFNMPS